MGIRATIDGIEVPVVRGEFPAFTFNVIDLEDPDKLKGSQSTSFRMPATREVRATLGGYGMSEYSGKRADLVVGNGGQVLYTSKVVPVERSADEYTVIAVGDNAEWFDLAKAKKLRDIPMGESETITDTLQRESWVDDEQALCFPVIDFGSFTDRGAAYNVTVNKLRPAIRPHVFLRAAFAAWGFSLRPMGSLGELWRKFCIPNTWGQIEISDNFRLNASAEFSQPTQLTFTTTGVDHEVTFSTVIFDPSGTYTGAGRYTPPFTQTTQVLFTYDLSAFIVAPFPTPQVMTAAFQLYDFANAIVLATQTLTFSIVNLNHIGVMNFGAFDISGADEIGIRVRLTSPAATHVLMVNTARVKYTVTDLEYQEGVTVDIAGQAPDMTVMEVLKGIAGNRCLIFRTNSAHGEVQVWADNEFYRDTSIGIDWRTRITHDPLPMKEEPLYTRLMEFRWKEDDDDQYVITENTAIPAPGYGNADIEMPDGVNDPLTIELPFAPTGMSWLFGSVFAPAIHKVDGTYQVDDYTFKPRLLIMEGVFPGEWTFDGVAETEYPKCYFVHPQGRWTLSFRNEELYGGNLLGTAYLQWEGRRRRMMSPRLNASVMIYPDEVWDLDQGVPRLVNDGFDDVWMYPTKVSQYRFDEIEYTETTLIPI